MGQFGILAVGAYIPRRRLARAAIAEANAWMNPGLKGQGKGHKAICNWDEDAITMAVEAGRNALDGYDGPAPQALSLASTNLPFMDRNNCGVVNAALNLGDDVQTIDLTGSLRVATSALMAGLSNGVPRMVLAADARLGKPGSVQEMQFGAGAAAVMFGEGDVLATHLGSKSLSRDLVDHYRMEGESFDYTLEERWAKDEGYSVMVPEVVNPVLEGAGVKPEEIDHFILPSVLRKVDAQTAKKLGIPAEAVVDNMNSAIGDAGAAHGLIMLTKAIEDAKAGAKILLVGFGQGCDAILLERTGQAATGPSVADALAMGVEDTEYSRYLSFRGLLEYDFGIRSERDNRTALSAFYRYRDGVTSMIGGRCTTCGTVQYPKSNICVNPNCNAVGTQEPHPFSDKKGKVKTFTEDYLAYTPCPPLQYGNVAIEEAGNIFMEFTDFLPGSLEVGTEMEMVFRIKDFDERRGFRRYFWKAAPLRG